MFEFQISSCHHGTAVTTAFYKMLCKDKIFYDTTPRKKHKKNYRLVNII